MYDFDAIDPWSEQLASVAWTIYSTHHTILKATPGQQLVFDRDMLLNLKFVADWGAIRLRKQKDIDRNSNKETSLKISHNYQAHDKVLIISNDNHRKLNCPIKGPDPIVQLYSNSTVHVQKRYYDQAY